LGNGTPLQPNPELQCSATIISGEHFPAQNRLLNRGAEKSASLRQVEEPTVSFATVAQRQ